MIKVRGKLHLAECLVALWPEDYGDDECTCLDWYADP